MINIAFIKEAFEIEYAVEKCFTLTRSNIEVSKVGNRYNYQSSN
jgi:hypothetical protein